MGSTDIIEITTTLKGFGIGFVCHLNFRNVEIYLGIVSISINFIKKTSENNWINYEHAQ